MGKAVGGALQITRNAFDARSPHGMMHTGSHVRASRKRMPFNGTLSSAIRYFEI